MNSNMTQHIYRLIGELADISLQRKLWLNENNDTGLMSSYSELMCSLFDDLGFDGFIDDEATKIGLSKGLIFKLSGLRASLNSYDEKDTDEGIISDPEWRKVVEQAKAVIEEWNKERVT
jgi:hypothetical protein